ncbi:DNA repair protein rad2 [Aspergillus hancockii]|nr:DNA repair protein rad2 [Aspergillus hancockii]
MGVHGLWTVVQPCARPIKLETLNKKRLAVDASIWIYQFLKAVRDKEGNALRNSHVVGFFRRICKLLFFGIKPVFVFDGGAPLLKRQTIAGRKKRREGRREDAVRTAGKLLAVQLQRTAEEEAARRKNEAAKEKEQVPDDPVYVEEVGMTEREKQQSRSFRKKDAYHLPDLHVSLEEMGAPNDPRIMSREELEEYAKQFYRGEDINLYDFSKIDFDSPFFISLPATDRYNILNAARLRSRLRMGYSKEQLDTMFPDRMAFSKFQIERVKERNDLTQRLMNINGMNGEEAFYNSGQRIAGERGKEYVLVKDNAVEGGWVLGVVGSKDEGQEHKPIDVDEYGKQDTLPEKDEESDDDGGFEDVPIEGLNRLPKLNFLKHGVFDASIRQQMRGTPGQRPSQSRDALPQDVEDDSLFVQDDGNGVLHNHSRPAIDGIFEGNGENEDEDLQKAINMSLEKTPPLDQQDYDMPEIPINRSSASLAQPKERTPSLSAGSDDDGLDFAAALVQSKRTKKEPSNITLEKRPTFDGPLPFESIKLDKPFESKKHQHEELDQHAGGFEKEADEHKQDNLPLPPWFSGAGPNAEFIADNDDNSLENYRDIIMTPDHVFLKSRQSPKVIDVDKHPDANEVIDLEADFEEPNSRQVLQAADRIEIPATNVATTPFEKYSVLTEATHLPAKDSIAADAVTGGYTTHGEMASSIEQANMLRTQPSPSPEFEDVEIHTKDLVTDVVVPEIETQTHQVDEPIDLVEEEGFSDPEDEELMRQLAAEGEEHVRFAATLNSTSHVENAFDYEQELKQLRSQQQKDRRDADEVTQVMIAECQQLLSLFGLPYITAPMEAEAQCAELVSLGLVDGIITDDSDIFLFGGTRVYKNMFNQGKFVECYLTSDLEKEYALHRRKLISFAHLLGSDYTEGIPGIGPVTALEILTEFSSLEEFRDWWTQVQMGINLSDGEHAAFFKKFKKQASKIFLSPSFPDGQVDVAYLEPEVDSDPSPFQWGVPDLHGLRNFLMATIGWGQERTDEVLVPVIRDMNRREQEGTQSNITAFFQGPQGAGAFAPRVRSGGQSRMEKAFNRLRQEAGSELLPSTQVQEAETTLMEQSESNGASTGSPAQGKKSTKRGAREVSSRDGDDVTGKKRRTRRTMKN